MNVHRKLINDTSVNFLKRDRQRRIGSEWERCMDTVNSGPSGCYLDVGMAGRFLRGKCGGNGDKRCGNKLARQPDGLWKKMRDCAQTTIIVGHHVWTRRESVIQTFPREVEDGYLINITTLEIFFNGIYDLSYRYCAHYYWMRLINNDLFENRIL